MKAVQFENTVDLYIISVHWYGSAGLFSSSLVSLKFVSSEILIIKSSLKHEFRGLVLFFFYFLLICFDNMYLYSSQNLFPMTWYEHNKGQIPYNLNIHIAVLHIKH